MDDVAVYLTPMVLSWQCKKRGLCCKYQRVPIDEVERRRIERLLREAGDPLAQAMAADKVDHHGDWPLLPVSGERCGFLRDDELCSLRTRFGEGSYPRTCKKFPYISLHTGERQVVGLSFLCPTALQLLAEETAFAIQVVEEAPTDSVAWLGGAERDYRDVTGRKIGADEFWVQHWSLFERFQARAEADPAERLLGLALELSGEPAPEPARLPPGLLRQGAFEVSVVRELQRVAGEAPGGLPWLWNDLSVQPFTLDALPPLDEDALLRRYLVHRIFCPVAYVSFADPWFLIATLFASLARYRIERERGSDPLTALRNLDRFFVHSAQAAAHIASESTNHGWRAMAALARAVTLD